MFQWLMRGLLVGGLGASMFGAHHLSSKGYGAQPVGRQVERSVRDQSRTGPLFLGRGFRGGK